MRIVGGSLRGRRLQAPADRSLRPTSERTRESLFDLLTQGRAAGGRDRVRDAAVMDAFAGTGALGLEALSRGAASVVFLEKAPAAARLIRRNAEALGVAQSARVLQGDALLPPAALRPVDLLLLDPPYGEGLALPALRALLRAGWLGPGSLVALEADAREDLDLPEGFDLRDDRRYGRARLLILEVSEPEAS
ncbi:MAG: 16S rRNA (guanine(966)-N(2))-methyltransferase RsmD [Rhodospirillales bacterium]